MESSPTRAGLFLAFLMKLSGKMRSKMDWKGRSKVGLHSRRISSQIAEGFKNEAELGHMLIPIPGMKLPHGSELPWNLKSYYRRILMPVAIKGMMTSFAKTSRNLKPLKTPPSMSSNALQGIFPH